VQIEDITGVGLTTWGTSEKEGHLTVGNGLLGQIVVDDETVHAVVTEVLTDGAAGVGSQELEGSSIGGSGGNDDGVLEGITLTKEAHDVGDGGSLLADGDVDAEKRLGQVTVSWAAFWLRMVSMAMAVFPVCLSPMISSR